MLFSCKISHSIASFLERRGTDLEGLYESIEVPGEFLNDPSYWLEADRMEAFLVQAEKQLGIEHGPDPLLTMIGRQASELRAWGALDSVLRIMQKAQDIYSQPARFISYFVAPEPPIANLVRNNESVSFALPISSGEFPKVTEYLAAAMEGLPIYLGQSLAQVTWRGNQISISWAENQPLLLNGDANQRHFKPELIESIMASLEESQRELEAKNGELVLKSQEILKMREKLHASLERQASLERMVDLSRFAENLSHEIKSPITFTMNNVHRLHDYLVRGGQMVTLMIGQNRSTPQVQEAMRRTDWEYVRAEFPNVVKETIAGLKKIQEIIRDPSFLVQSHREDEKEKAVDLPLA